MNQVEKISPKQTDESIVYRDQKKRYPWWVKSVDRITTETDDSRLKNPEDRRTAASKDRQTSTKKEACWEEIIKYTVKGIRENIPGRTLPDKTLLHEVAHITASKMPRLGKLLVKLDDLFGYGRKTNGRDINKWWDQKNPTRGINSNQGRRT